MSDKIDEEYEIDEAWERNDPAEDYWEDYWAFIEGECHLNRRGECGLAGSEWCEFECPFRR